MPKIPTHPETPPAIRILVWAALTLTLALRYLPLNPLMPGTTLDQAWEFGLNEALAMGMAFGREVVFTFGPYASVYTRTFHPAIDWHMLAASAYLAITYISAVYVVAGRARIFWLAAFMAATIISESRDALLFSHCLMAGLAATKLTINFIDRLNHRFLTAISLFAVLSPMGLLPLVKGSLLVVAAAALLPSIAIALLARKPFPAAIATASPLIACVTAWAAAGQSSTDLSSYIFGVIQLSAGYTEAMQIGGPTGEISAYIVAATLLIAVLLQDHNRVREKCSTAFLLLLFTFVAFKAGFVRHDGHALIAASSILMAGAIIAIAHASQLNAPTFIIGFAAFSYIFVMHHQGPALSTETAASNIFSDSIVGIRNRLEPGHLSRRFHAALENIAKERALPTLTGASDIYSYGQSHLIASSNRWQPRPIMQSYAAYTKPLSEKNATYLREKGAPNVFFGIEPIDSHFPSLEDGSTWPEFLQHYTPSSVGSGYLVLKREEMKVPSTLNEKFGVATLNESISVPDSKFPLYLRLSVKPTFAGKIASLLYKSTPLQINVTQKDGSSRSFRLISGMASAGFLLSPIIEKAEDFALLYGGIGLLEKNKISYFSVTSPEDRSNIFWSKEISFSISEMDASTKRLGTPAIWREQDREHSFAAGDIATRDCEGSLDFINNLPAANAKFKSKLFTASGWLAESTAHGALAEKTYIIFSRPDEAPKLFEAYKVPRPDVANHFGDKRLINVGYLLYGNAGELSGKYEVGMAFQSKLGLQVCRSPKFEATMP